MGKDYSYLDPVAEKKERKTKNTLKESISSAMTEKSQREEDRIKNIENNPVFCIITYM